MSEHHDIKTALVKQEEVKSKTEHDLDNPDSSSCAPSSGNTLLPSPVASLVSLFAQSTSLSLRLGTLFGGAAIDGARVTTLTGLELSRAVIEGILTRAGRDVAVRSNGTLGRAEAESLLERSVSIDDKYLDKIVADDYYIAGYFAFDGYLGVLLRICKLSSLFCNSVIHFGPFTKSAIRAGRDTWIHRVVTSYCRHHNSNSKGV